MSTLEQDSPACKYQSQFHTFAKLFSIVSNYLPDYHPRSGFGGGRFIGSYINGATADVPSAPSAISGGGISQTEMVRNCGHGKQLPLFDRLSAQPTWRQILF